MDARGQPNTATFNQRNATLSHLTLFTKDGDSISKGEREGG